MFLMCIMTIFVLSACSKSDDKEPEKDAIVGGEDVTDLFLNPGGKIVDKGVNIVGAWAFCETSTPNLAQEGFIIINSKGEVTEYDTFKSPYEFELDSKGVLHCYHSDIKEGEMGGWPCKGGKTMIEALLGWAAHDPESEMLDFKVTYKDEKTGKFGYQYAFSGWTGSSDCVLTNRDVDTYYYTIKSYYSDSPEETQTLYMRRIKSLLD